MKGLHSGVFLEFRCSNGSKVNHLQIKGFKIDTKEKKKWATEINKVYVSFAGRKILHRQRNIV